MNKRWWLPGPLHLSAEQDMEQALAKLPPYGTVPYHQHWARSAVRTRRINIVVAAGQLALLTLQAKVGQWYIAPVFGGLLMLSTWTIVRQSDRITEHRQKAWEVETRQTMQGMAESGMFEITDAIVALRDGPMPPGNKRKEWVRWHNEMLDRINGSD